MEPTALDALLPEAAAAAAVAAVGVLTEATGSSTSTAAAGEEDDDSVGSFGEFDGAVRAARTFLLGAIFLTGSVCCALALTTCYRRRRELKSTASAFVVNLCVGDLLICLLLVPIMLMDTAWRPSTAGFDVRWCQIEGALTTTLFVASSLNSCAVSIDRYVAVRQSLRYASWFSKGTCNGIITASWTAAVCIGAAPLLSRALPVSASSAAAAAASVVTPPSPEFVGGCDYYACVYSPLPGASYKGVAYASFLTGAAFLAPLAVHAYVYLSIYQATKNTTALARRNSVQTPPPRPPPEPGGDAPGRQSAPSLPPQLQQQRGARPGRRDRQHRQIVACDPRHQQHVHQKPIVQQQPPQAPQQPPQEQPVTDCASGDAACTAASDGGGVGGHGRKAALRRPSWQMRLVHKDDRKAAKMGVIVVFSFIFSWAPLYFFMLAVSLGAEADIRYGWLPVLLALSDCVVNPLVYVLRSKRSLELLKCKAAPTFGGRSPSKPKCFSISRVPNNSSKRLIEASDEYSGAEIYA